VRHPVKQFRRATIASLSKRHAGLRCDQARFEGRSNIKDWMNKIAIDR
jgi:hypothetical protein